MHGLQSTLHKLGGAEHQRGEDRRNWSGAGFLHVTDTEERRTSLQHSDMFDVNQEERLVTSARPLCAVQLRSGWPAGRSRSSWRAQSFLRCWPSAPAWCPGRDHARLLVCRWTRGSGWNLGTVWGRSASSPSLCPEAARWRHMQLPLKSPTEVTGCRQSSNVVKSYREANYVCPAGEKGIGELCKLLQNKHKRRETSRKKTKESSTRPATSD